MTETSPRWEEEYHLFGQVTKAKDHSDNYPMDCEACQKEYSHRISMESRKE
jgi:hypothetical protein